MWPDNKEERLYDFNTQNQLVFDYKNATQPTVEQLNVKKYLFAEEHIEQINHFNTEKSFPEFNREKLMPYG